MEVLSERERASVKGFVVNRFRGREEFLAGAHDYVLRHTGRPVLGVVPWLDGAAGALPGLVASHLDLDPLLDSLQPEEALRA